MRDHLCSRQNDRRGYGRYSPPRSLFNRVRHLRRVGHFWRVVAHRRRGDRLVFAALSEFGMGQSKPFKARDRAPKAYMSAEECEQKAADLFAAAEAMESGAAR